MLVSLAGLQAAVAARLGAGHAGSSLPPTAQESDRLLKAEEVAEQLRRSVDWVYRHAKHWPFTRRLTRRTMRFSEAGLRHWLAAQKGVNDGRRGGMVGASILARKEQHAARPQH